MTVTTDNFALYAAFICTVFSFLLYTALSVFPKGTVRDDTPKYARAFYVGSAVSVAYSSVYFLQQILSLARYDIAYIYNYSSSTDALIYRLSSFWAGQEGSLLFWTLVTAAIGLVIMRRSGYGAMAFWSGLQLFLAFMLVASDPFSQLTGGHMPHEGLGLNPLLKNPWMAVHPPVIFIAYAVLGVPAAIAFDSLVTGKTSVFAKVAFPYVLFGWISLTVGIGLGMVWSYGVLGWGGYWGWDPVENASLIPWLVSTALLHSLSADRARNRMRKTGIMLAFATFFFVVFATFLTRSSVLASFSNHSFADSGLSSVLIAFLLAALVIPAIAIALRVRNVAKNTAPLPTRSLDTVTVLGVILLICFALMVLAGTLVPPITGSAVPPDFFIDLSVPLTILILALIAVSAWLRWSVKTGEGGPVPGLGRFFYAFIVVAVASVVAGNLAYFRPVTAQKLMWWLVDHSGENYRLAAQMLVLLFGSALIALWASASRATTTRPLNSGAYISHAGVAIMVLGMLLNSAGTSKTLKLEKGGPAAKAFGYEMVYLTELTTPGGMQSVITVTRGDEVFQAPMHVTKERGLEMRHPFVKKYPLYDLYIAPVEIKSPTVRPSAVVTADGWRSKDVTIEGTDSSISLLSINADAKSAVIMVINSDSGKKSVTLKQGESADIDGLELTLADFFMASEESGEPEAGVVLSVGGDVPGGEMVVEVSTKPFISLVFAGIILITSGGIIAFVRRTKDAGSGQEDGLAFESPEDSGNNIDT